MNAVDCFLQMHGYFGMVQGNCLWRPRSLDDIQHLPDTTTVYRLFKIYPTVKWQVGYFRTRSELVHEISYLDRYEHERVPISYDAEVVPLLQVPDDIIARWKREDDAAKLAEERAKAPIMLPRVRKPWPSLFADEPIDGNRLLAEANQWSRCRPIRKPFGKPR
jgi:hypothetical protein